MATSQTSRFDILPVNSLNPWTTLPAELIALIIQIGAAIDWLFPVRAAAVCFAWRRAAHHYPRSWSKAIITRVGYRRAIHREYQLVRLYLRRSCEAPIELTLDLSRASDPQSVVFLRLFSRELWRCTKFTFTGRVPHKVISLAFRDLWHPHSRVGELSLTLNTGNEGFAPESTSAEEPYPVTSSWAIRMFPYMRRLQLNFLVANGMPPEALVSIFVSYPYLESLDVRLGNGTPTATNLWPISNATPLLAPPYLRHLHLEGLSILDLIAILDFKSLHLISLCIHTLGVHARSATADYVNPPLPAVLCNPSSTLRKLELGGLSLNGPHFLPFLTMLRGLPELTKLSFSHVRLDAQLFHTLSCPMPGMLSWVVPQLESIEMHQATAIANGLVSPRQSSAWVMDVARQRNVASKCGGPVAKVEALRCDVVGRDGRVLLDLREMALSGPIGVQVSATGHNLTFWV